MKISVDAFKAQVARDAARTQDPRDEKLSAETENLRRRLEGSHSGILTLSTIAMAERSFDSFPEEVSLAAPNGHNAGLTAKKVGRTWRLGGDIHVLSNAAQYGFGVSRPWNEILRALGVATGPQAYAAISSHVLGGKQPFREAVTSFIDSLRYLPPHCLSSSVAVGDRLLRSIGVEESDLQEAARFLVRTAMDTGADLTTPPSAGMLSAVETLASRPFDHVLAPALSVTPGAHGVVASAAWLAAINLNRAAIDAMVQAYGLGLTQHVYVDGSTLLHAVADGLSRSPGESNNARWIIGFLAAADATRTDDKGRTAADRIILPHEDDEDARYAEDVRDVIEILNDRAALDADRSSFSR